MSSPKDGKSSKQLEKAVYDEILKGQISQLRLQVCNILYDIIKVIIIFTGYSRYQTSQFN